MKKTILITFLSLTLSVCGGNEESDNQIITTSQEDKIENTETQVSESSTQSETNNEKSDKISKLRDKCEIFANASTIEAEEYFFILGDDIDILQRESIYNHPSGAQNGPFQTWTFNEAVKISSEIIPEEFDVINPFENNIGITWEKFEEFADALCFAYENDKGLRNVTILHAELMGRSNELLAFASNLGTFSLY